MNSYYQAFKQYLNYVANGEGRKRDTIYIEDEYRLTAVCFYKVVQQD
jgi:hypothetical protein